MSVTRGFRNGVFVAGSAALAAVAWCAAGFTTACVVLIFFATVTPLLVWHDICDRRLPNRFVYPTIAVGVLAAGAEWLDTGKVPAIPIAAALTIGGFLLVLHTIGGMGMGDVKLGVAIGLASWVPGVAVLSPVVSFLLGGLVSAALLLWRGRGGSIAFGPFLLAGFWITVALQAAARLVV